MLTTILVDSVVRDHELGIPLCRHPQPRRIESYTGETVADAGQFYTDPVLLQQRKHHTNESFEVSPMEVGIDIFLPFQWIEEHPLQGTWSTEEIRFNSPCYLGKCTKFEANEFSLTLDEEVAKDPRVQVIG